MTPQLIVLLNGREVGRVHRDRRGRLSFVYDDNWRSAIGAYPLSISMPITAAEHGHSVIESFLWGLLPDNEAILDHWARRFQVSPRNPFALISHVGEDCAGAAQFVRPERVEVCLAAKAEPVEWLNDDQVAERLKLLRADNSAWRAPRDSGQFSLAGAQPKTALLFEDGQWGVPSGRTPTTHILKPPAPAFDGHVENEHFCLSLARRLGLPTTESRVLHFKDETAIVIDRYDRYRIENGLIRVHQEDICQAMAVPPTRKYENEGGPGVRAIVELLRIHSGQREEDVLSFVNAVALNWVTAGTDAHAKNYALLIGSGGRVRLAPLYDLASALPYPQMDFQKLKLAMKIGGDYRLRNIGQREWRRLAGDLRLDPDDLVDRVAELADRLPGEAAVVRDGMRTQGVNHTLVDRLFDRLSKRAVECSKLLRNARV